MKPTVAIIGLGVMGQRMLANMAMHQIFGAIDGWDPDATACDRARFIVPELRIAADPLDLITDNQTDIVYIACPPAHHRTYAMAAIDAGKTIFCEKPLGIDISESISLVDAVETAGNKHAVNFSLASAVAVEFIEQSLTDGTIGTVQAVDIQLHFSQWPRDWQIPATWLSQRIEGGFVRETFSHYAYLLQRLFGPTTIKSAYTRYPDDGISAEIQSIAALDCNGIPVSFTGGTGGIASSQSDTIEFTIWGTDAICQLFDWNRVRTSIGQGWTEHLTDIPDLRQEGYRRGLQNLDHLWHERPHRLPTFRNALDVQQIVEGILADRTE